MTDGADLSLSVPSLSQAVLIGVSAYAHFPPLPAAVRNVDLLEQLITDDTVWGLPEPNCIALTDPSRGEDVLSTILDRGTKASDTLLVYFAGHGLIDTLTDDLLLALPTTKETFEALRFETIRDVLVDRRVRAQRKVVILDCCYSGRATRHWMSVADIATQVAELTEIEDSCILTATNDRKRALAPEEATYTAFTGALIDILSRGIPHAPELLSMNTIYTDLSQTLRARAHPKPELRSRNTGGHTAWVKNKAHTGVEKTASQPTPTGVATPAVPPRAVDPPKAVPDLADMVRSTLSSLHQVTTDPPHPPAFRAHRTRRPVRAGVPRVAPTQARARAAPTAHRTPAPRRPPVVVTEKRNAFSTLTICVTAFVVLWGAFAYAFVGIFSLFDLDANDWMRQGVVGSAAISAVTVLMLLPRLLRGPGISRTVLPLALSAALFLGVCTGAAKTVPRGPLDYVSGSAPSRQACAAADCETNYRWYHWTKRDLTLDVAATFMPNSDSYPTFTGKVGISAACEQVAHWSIDVDGAVWRSGTLLTAAGRPLSETMTLDLRDVSRVAITGHVVRGPYNCPLEFYWVRTD